MNYNNNVDDHIKSFLYIILKQKEWIVMTTWITKPLWDLNILENQICSRGRVQQYDAFNVDITSNCNIQHLHWQAN